MECRQQWRGQGQAQQQRKKQEKVVRGGCVSWRIWTRSFGSYCWYELEKGECKRRVRNAFTLYRGIG